MAITATVTNIAAQLTSRIQALSGTETLEDLLILKKASENTGVLPAEISTLDAAITTLNNSLSGSSSDEDLLIASRASATNTDIDVLAGEIESHVTTESDRVIAAIPAPTGLSLSRIQRGVTLMSGATFSQSILPVNVSRTTVNMLGFITSDSTTRSSFSYVSLSGASSLTMVRDSSSGNVTVSWEIIEYV